MTVENVEWSNADDPGTWADPPAVGRLGEIRVPTLVITGGTRRPADRARSATSSPRGSPEPVAR